MAGERRAGTGGIAGETLHGFSLRGKSRLPLSGARLRGRKFLLAAEGPWESRHRAGDFALLQRLLHGAGLGHRRGTGHRGCPALWPQRSGQRCLRRSHGGRIGGLARIAGEAGARLCDAAGTRSSQPAIREIVEGMADSASRGTAAGLATPGLHRRLLAKTGTAPCTHRRRAPADGFAMVAWPADSPRYLLLVRQHGVPGAQAAVLAGRMLRALEP
jgi:hypothetical protein